MAIEKGQNKNHPRNTTERIFTPCDLIEKIQNLWQRVKTNLIEIDDSAQSSSSNETCNPCLNLASLMQVFGQTPIRCQKKDGSFSSQRESRELGERVFRIKG